MSDLVSRTKAASSSRTPRVSKTAGKAREIDRLADSLSTGLHITRDVTRTRARIPNEEKRSQSMRSVNASLQALSTLIQSGWKMSGKTQSSRVSSAKAIAAAESAHKHLSILRRLSTKDTDVERAAISVLGKLIALDMYDLAYIALQDLHQSICLILSVPSSYEGSSHHVPLISITLPSPPPANHVLLTIISTYLVNALTIMSLRDMELDQLSMTLISTSAHTLLSWMPYLKALPEKHVDCTLTKVYTTLTNLCSTMQNTVSSHAHRSSVKSTSIASAQSIFRIRIYAIECLGKTSPGIVDPHTYWGQVNRFALVFARNVSGENEEESSRTILAVFSRLYSQAQLRVDKESFLKLDYNTHSKSKGGGLPGLFDSWMAFAKRVGDIDAMEKISGCMQPSVTSPRPVEPRQEGTAMSSPVSEEPLNNVNLVMLEGTRICALFAQITVLLERHIEEVRESGNYRDLLTRTKGCISMMKSSKPLILLLHRRSNHEDRKDWVKARDKTSRALERMRRSAVKALESSASSQDASLQQIARELLETCTTVLENVLHPPSVDVITHILDNAFVLSKAQLAVSDPRTYVPAFEYLSHAASLLKSLESSEVHGNENGEEGIDLNLANYVRCLSGAFHNLAGVLYQAARYGATVSFLREACTLGRKALSMRTTHWDTRDEKDIEAWKQLEEHLCRRWELLGICYLKNGDRQNAYHSFIQYLQAFPFTSCALMEMLDSASPTSVFSSTTNAQIQHLGTIVDRITYLGSCELLLHPTEISLRSLLSGTPNDETSATAIDGRILGAFLERQYDSLEPSRWKEGVMKISGRLLQDTLDVYSANEEMPLRRARVLLRCLEFMFRGGDKAIIGDGNPVEIAKQVECLLKQEDLRQDKNLAQYCIQYRASSHLWLALHAHRRSDVDQNSIAETHIGLARGILLDFLATEVRDSKRRKSSGGHTLGAIVESRKSLVSEQVIPSPKRKNPKSLRTPAAPRKTALTRSRLPHMVRKAVTNDPQAPALAPLTPPRSTHDKASMRMKSLEFDDVQKFIGLLRLAARILGLLSLTLPKVHILQVTRRICALFTGTKSDEFISASLDLAHEYVKIGKIKRASVVFQHALDPVRNGQVSNEISILLLLRFAEMLALVDDIHQSCHVYCEANHVAQKLAVEDKTLSTVQRIHNRANRLEKVALASQVFALIQASKDDATTALESMLQSLRLWNRAVESLARLHPYRCRLPSESDPFEVDHLRTASPDSSSQSASVARLARRSSDCLELRALEGLLSILLALCETYHLRGSAREALFFNQQALELAETLNAPVILGRVLAKRAEIQLRQGLLSDSLSNLDMAVTVIDKPSGVDVAEIYRVKGAYQENAAQKEDALRVYEKSLGILEEFDQVFNKSENVVNEQRPSLGVSPSKIPYKDSLMPDLSFMLLHQRIWLLRGNTDEIFQCLLQKLTSISYSTLMKANEHALMAKLTLHDVHERLRSDMFLSSLAESAIMMPMGVTGDQEMALARPAHDITNALTNVEKLYWTSLSLIGRRGSAVAIRESLVSLALARAFQTSLGKPVDDSPWVAANLIDASAAITLRREMIELIGHKFSDFPDDLLWRTLQADGTPNLLGVSARLSSERLHSNNDGDFDDSENEETSLRKYWESVRIKYLTHSLHDIALSTSRLSHLPPNWSVVHIIVSEDRNTLFVSRQNGGRDTTHPLIFCVPLKGRRDLGAASDEEGHLTFEDALQEFREIVRLSNEGTKTAIHVKSEAEQARAQWWKQRMTLDMRMSELLENIEFCWLGAFKTILNRQCDLTKEAVEELRTQFVRVFERSLSLNDTKSKRPRGKATAKSRTPRQVTLDDALIRCFATLSPKCKDEEIEDLVYFILDLYQFHGVPVAIAEVDITQVVIDLRMVLEECASKIAKQNITGSFNLSSGDDEHVFMVLDKNLQGLPWESIPSLRGRSVSRIPSVDFLLDRIEYAHWRRQKIQPGACATSVEAVIDPRKGYYILNPSGDLLRTEERFKDWATGMQKTGWDGVIGKPVSEQQFLHALRTLDLVVYFGHGGGEQYVRSQKIRTLPSCAATMLWGCSSGALHEMGDFDRTGTPYNYMLAGCPTLVANLWDVTDRDIDKLSQSVFDKMGLLPGELGNGKRRTSVVAAVAQSRNSCKLKYLTGAAPVVYGIPFYL